MKKTLELLPIGLLALSACTPKDAGNGYELLNQLPVVAQTVNVDGQEITVNDFNLLKDTIDLPLSFWLEDFQVVKLDDRNEASADMGPAARRRLNRAIWCCPPATSLSCLRR